MRRLMIALAAASLVLSGCSGDGEVSEATPGANEDWVETPKADALPEYPHSNYTFTYSYSSQIMQYTATARVQDGEVASVELEDPEPSVFATRGTTEQYEKWSSQATVDFIIETARETRETGEAVVEWEDSKEYPDRILLDPLPKSVDDESSWEILNVEVEDAIPSGT